MGDGDIGDGDGAAFRGEPESHAPPHAFSAPGDDSNFIFEQHISPPLMENQSLKACNNHTAYESGFQWLI